ncbi:putative cysteine-rich receptor-like protein kinase 43 [Tripterygium wilfordii]|uniref:putative cysteine-rich receptor-like protein kinase 43 n=1 Tax=Tripterygium wilfordii TaxID=458696 RepID=UPI0018F82794|nr:putative cysteine-rich receptor-like protein kinase 43 [Tripterygium wilfordii]
MCGDVHVQNVSNYFTYFADILKYMEEVIPRNKVAIKEAGVAPDKLYVLAQCMDDLTSKDCETCFNQINTLMSGCFPSTGGRVFLDGCFMRAENYSFYLEDTGPLDSKRCSSDKDIRKEFKNAVRKVISKMLRTASAGGGFAVHEESSKGVTAYGMAICWEPLDPRSCSKCLADAAANSLRCLPSTDARALNAGCFLRYSNYWFASNVKSRAIEAAIFVHASWIIGMVAICTSAVGVGLLVGKCTYKRANRRKKTRGTEPDLLALTKSLEILPFKYSTLEKATDNFNEGHKLGRGGYGEVFMGTLPDGREIAIKRLYVSGKSRLQEVCNEMDVISRAQHKNLVRFLGCCFTSVDSFLVYEYLANRSLDFILFDPVKKAELDWKKRFGIITGTAEGLEYLHKDCQVRIIHRDIKASNILLDLKHRPKISDFGLARFYTNEQSFVSITNGIAGTLGYMAPEYIARGRLTEKVDIYSFGILVLEIVSGVQNNRFLQYEESMDTLVTHVWKHFESNTLSNIIDKNLSSEDVGEIKRVVQLGLLCTQESPSKRPSMTEVVQMLRQREIALPTPSKPPFIDENMELSSPSGTDPRQSSHVSDLWPEGQQG